MKAPIANYVNIINEFLNGHLSATEFEARYLAMFKNDSSIRPEEEYNALNRLFSDIDMFCADPALSTNHNLDENQLRVAARNTLKTITQSPPTGGNSQTTDEPMGEN